MQCPVSCATDMTFVLPISMSMHDYFPAGPCPPLPPPSPIGADVEIPMFVFWPTGYVLGKNKLTSKVLHCGVWFGLEGHDLGPGLMHLPTLPVPANALMPIHILKSKRKANFAAGEVKAEGKPIAHMLLLNLPPTPMTTCGSPISAPTSCATTSLANTLLIGVHIVDLIAGWVSIGINLAFDAATMGAMQTPSAPGGWLGGWTDDLLGDPFGDFSLGDAPAQRDSGLGTPEGAVEDNAAGIWAGLIRLAGQELGIYHGDARVGVSLGNSAWSVEGSFSRSGEDGRMSVGASQGLSGPGGVAEAQVSERVSFGAGRDVEGEIQGEAGIGAGQISGGHTSNATPGQQADEGFAGAATWNGL